MSNADVEFKDRYRLPAKPGDELFFSFLCPRHPHRCGQLLLAGHDGRDEYGNRARWEWNGDRQNPTFSPSINCRGCWHGYIEKGRCVDIAKADEPGLPA